MLGHALTRCLPRFFPFYAGRVRTHLATPRFRTPTRSDTRTPFGTSPVPAHGTSFTARNTAGWPPYTGTLPPVLPGLTQVWFAHHAACDFALQHNAATVQLDKHRAARLLPPSTHSVVWHTVPTDHATACCCGRCKPGIPAWFDYTTASGYFICLWFISRSLVAFYTYTPTSLQRSQTQYPYLTVDAYHYCLYRPGYHPQHRKCRGLDAYSSAFCLTRTLIAYGRYTYHRTTPTATGFRTYRRAATDSAFPFAERHNATTPHTRYAGSSGQHLHFGHAAANAYRYTIHE